MRRIIVLIVLLHLTLSGISQIASDSITCLPNSKLRAAIKKIEDCKILREELEQTQKGIIILETRVNLKDSIISDYEAKDFLWQKTMINYDSIVLNLNKQIINDKAINTIQSFKLKTLKINKWLYAGAGLIAGFLLCLLK